MNTTLAAPLAAPQPAAPWDGTLALWADPYRWIGRTCAALGRGAFETRLLLQPTLCMSGAAAARVFYDTSLFERAGAAPEPLLATLLGKGGVQGLDGSAHRRRKSLFVEQTGPASTAALVARTRHEWRAVLPGWQRAGAFPLYRALQPVLARAALDWAGVPLPPADVPRRTAQLVALFDGAGRGLWPHLRARWARWRLEAWLAPLVADVRERRVRIPAGSPLEAVAWHRDGEGRLLAPRIAAVELLNLVRPVVAVSVYMTFVAHALRVHGAERQRLLADGPHSRAALDFVREVRRHAPFFPAVAARVREPFEWGGVVFRRGRRALLDLCGTNHDPAAWDAPHAFRPQRFQERPPGAFDFVPQGGADAVHHHRCPGEDIATQLMLLTLSMLLQEMHFDVVPQDLAIDMARLPALPRGGFLIERVQSA